MAVTLTENAAKHVQTMLAQRGSGVGLRLSTKKSGCSGFAYVVDYADTLQSGDQVFECHGVKVIVDGDSAKLLEGIQVDYVTNGMLKSEFVFNNPNVKAMCGCGESFTI